MMARTSSSDELGPESEFSRPNNGTSIIPRTLAGWVAVTVGDCFDARVYSKSSTSRARGNILLQLNSTIHPTGIGP